MWRVFLSAIIPRVQRGVPCHVMSGYQNMPPVVITEEAFIIYTAMTTTVCPLGK